MMNQRRSANNDEVYNIILIHNLLDDHPSLRFPEVRVAAAALRAVGDLRRPPFSTWEPHYDLLDWLALFFGFQASNVNNQREHLVLHLSNAQMRLSPPPDNIDTLDPAVLRRFRRRFLNNYTSWCSYLNLKSNIWLSDSSRNASGDHRRGLLYVSLYLLIWGESANIRFVPECICYIFHNMAMELNKILEDYIDENTGRITLEVAVVFIAPELLALALFVLPWIRNFLENINWKIFYLLSWWFQSKTFVGRGLREDLVENIKYTLFWIVVLATKFAFSYFMQIKPMIAPTKSLLDLKNVDYEWHEFFGHSNRFAVGLLWLLVISWSSSSLYFSTCKIVISLT